MVAEDNPPIFSDLIRFQPDGMSLNAWAVIAGVSRTVWADMRRHGNPSRRTLEKLLKAAGSSLAEFEALRIGDAVRDDRLPSSGFSDRQSRPWEGGQLPGLSLLANAPNGSWGNPASRIELNSLSEAIIGSVARPASLAGDSSAYAVPVVGDSMWPRFRPGRIVAVSGSSIVGVGDDVLVKLTVRAQDDPTVSVLIKELVSRDDRNVQLRQFNPDVTFQVPVTDIASIERVLGELV